MKPIKMFGIATLAALMAMAFVGASSAMSEPTVLCKADESSCSGANTVTAVHEVSVGKATLLSSAINVECIVLFSSSTVTPGAPEIITGNFAYSSCNSGCVVTEESAHSTIEVLKEGHETGKVTGEGLVHVNCSGFIDCSYNGVGLTGAAKGPLLSTQANGEVTLSGQKTNKETGGFLCPKEAKLDITTTPLTATYIGLRLLMACIRVASGTGGLYKKAGQNGSCTEMTNTNTRDGEFELAEVKSSLAVGAMACGYVGANNGLLLTENANKTECTNNDSPLREGAFELGTIENLE
jgi:hypothetical protein